MISTRILRLNLSVLTVFNLFPPSTKADHTVTIGIDNTIQHQRMDGFGVTHVSGEWPGIEDVLTPDQRRRMIDAVYGQVRINLGNLASAYLRDNPEYPLGPGDNSIIESSGNVIQRQNDDSDPFHINWNGFVTTAATSLKTKLLDLAGPFGFRDYYIADKINLRNTSPWMQALRATDYNLYLEECAEQVMASQIFWRDNFGIVPKYQHLFNEPLSGNGEVVDGNPQELADIVKRAGARLRSAGLSDMKFILPNEETESVSINTISGIMADAEARQYVGVLGYHTYPYGSAYSSVSNILRESGRGTPNQEAVRMRQTLKELAAEYSLPLWMTEVADPIGDTDPLSFDDLRGRAIHIHDELVYANAAAYFGMGNMWDEKSSFYHSRSRDLSTAEGMITLIYNDEGRDDIKITGMGYAIGHYARWIRPGAVRIEATTNDPLVQVTAFRDDAQSRMVVVIINNSTTGTTINANLTALQLTGTLRGEQSTAAASWRSINPFNPANPTNFSVVLPPLSVTTISGEFGTPAQHTLTVNNGSGSGSYTAGTTVNIAARTPDPGMTFARWTGDVTYVANPNLADTTVIMPARNVTVTATYEPIPPQMFTLTVNNGSGGGIYQAGSVVNIGAHAPPSGMIFDQWTGDTATVANVNLANTALTMPAQNASVTATYKPRSPGRFILTVNSGTGSGSYVAGTVVDITAHRVAGMIFDRWSGPDASMAANPNSANTTITMPSANAMISATYRPDLSRETPSTEIKIGPNPWLATDNAGRPITFEGLKNGEAVSIYTQRGNLVKHLIATNGIATWDLKDSKGDQVPAGTYLCLIGNSKSRVVIIK